MSIIKYFSNKKYKLYKRTLKIDPQSGGSIVKWVADREIPGYFEPNENLVGSQAGNKYGIKGVFYSEEKLNPSDRILINDNVFEIRDIEFRQMFRLSYYKGYLVNTDENI